MSVLGCDRAVPMLLGPLTFVWLAHVRPHTAAGTRQRQGGGRGVEGDDNDDDDDEMTALHPSGKRRVGELLGQLTPLYQGLLRDLAQTGVKEVQVGPPTPQPARQTGEQGGVVVLVDGGWVVLVTDARAGPGDAGRGGAAALPTTGIIYWGPPPRDQAASQPLGREGGRRSTAAMHRALAAAASVLIGLSVCLVVCGGWLVLSRCTAARCCRVRVWVWTWWRASGRCTSRSSRR